MVVGKLALWVFSLHTFSTSAIITRGRMQSSPHVHKVISFSIWKIVKLGNN